MVLTAQCCSGYYLGLWLLDGLGALTYPVDGLGALTYPVDGLGANGWPCCEMKKKANEMLHDILADCFETVDANCHAYTLHPPLDRAASFLKIHF